MTQRPAGVGPTMFGPTSPASQNFEIALSIFRRALPDCGLKLVLPPPGPDSEHPQAAYASVWRRGEGRAACHDGRTVADALLSAMRAECERRRNRDLLADCTRCCGTGRYVAAGGVLTICDHRAAG
ncbi:MAG TPA: hypothetical protein VGL35_06320 [Rhizomicrobium sp.]